MTRPFAHATLLVTTRCDRACPRCCYRVSAGGLGPPRDFPLEEVLAAGPVLADLETLCVSGGEPGLHPDLERIAVELRARLRPRRLDLATNGRALLDHPEVVPRFEQVRVTNYGDPRVVAAAADLQRRFPGRIFILPEVARHRADAPLTGRGPCVPPLREIAAWLDGRLYPCCVAPGRPGAAFVEPLRDPGWEDAYRVLALPCGGCPFSTEVP